MNFINNSLPSILFIIGYILILPGVSMKKIVFFSLLSAFFISCDVSTIFDNEPYNLVVGSRSNTLYQTSPDLADSLYKDFKHLDIRDMDLNNDLLKEFYIVSEEDSVFEDGSDDFRYYRKRLTIEKNPLYEGRLSIATDSNGNIQVFNQGEVVNPETHSFEIINDEKYLCDFSIDANQQVINYGHWNGKIQRFLVISARFNDVVVAAWVRITVEKFDNYVFYGFASFNTDWATYNE